MDLQELKERLDLLAELEKDLGPGKKSGRWVMFSCPFPGHAHGDAKPSLAATPENGRYYCFTCGATGDLITWLLEYRRMTWKDIHDLATGGNLPPAQPRRSPPPPAPSGPPPAAWQERGREFMTACETALHGPGGERARAYLLGRGLTLDTIQEFRLGYNPRPINDDPTRWGFDLVEWIREHSDNKHPDKLWLPRGITIPYLIGGNLWAVNVRRPIRGEHKYHKIAGGPGGLYNADWILGADIVLLTEGEFDCMIAHQELNDVVACATLGSANKQLDLATWGDHLLGPRAILAALDPDKAGRSGAAALAALSARIHPVRVPHLRPGDKDLTDYHLAGGDLWQWLKHNLDRLGLLAGLGLPTGDPAQALDPAPADELNARQLGHLAPAPAAQRQEMAINGTT